MNKYLLMRKVIQDISLVLIMTVIIFIVFRLMPGNPAELFITVSRTGYVNPHEYQARLDQLGLQNGKYSLTDFETYVYQMFTFNWGADYINHGELVSTEIAQALPYTLVLIGTTSILSFAFGIPLGIWVSKIRGTKKEGAVLSISLIVNSIPYFIIGVFLFLYFVVALGWFPIKAQIPLSYIESPTPYTIGVLLYDMALPFFSLLFIETAGHMITMRAAMVSTLGEDHITTARAKGVPEKSILRKHAARIAVIPVTTRLALQIAFLMSGSLIVAIIFNWPGMGPLLYKAVLHEDYPLSEASTFIISLLTILAYSLIDYIHAYLDPRIKV